MNLIGWVIFIVALLFSVMLHETGHFVTAKKFGMKVTRYFVGFGPTLWSTRRGETEYRIKALALGIGIENDNTTQLGSISKCLAANTTQLNNGTCTASDQASPAKQAGLRIGDQVTAFN